MGYSRVLCALALALVPLLPAQAADLFAGAPPATRKFPVFAAYGVDSPEAVGKSAEAGINCIVLEARPEFGQADWNRLEALIAATQERGLYLCLATTLFWPGGEPMPFDPAYRMAMAKWLQGLAERYGRLPNLLGWQIAPGTLENLRGDAAAFQQLLRERYPSLDALNQAWDTKYKGWIEIKPSTEIPKSTSPLFPPAPRVVEGAYYLELYRRLVLLWAQAIMAGDPSHPLFSGPLPVPKLVAAAPKALDCLQPEVAPEAAPGEVGIAVDLGRRGGAFLAAPVMRLSEGQGAEGVMLNLATALAHGASGVFLDDWRTAAPALDQARLQQVAAQFDDAGPVVARLGILLEPWAPQTVTDLGGGPYGFIADEVLGGPAGLVDSLASGSIFGAPQILAEEDLPETDLSQCSAVLCPAALSLDEPGFNALTSYAYAGGVLAADLGLGALQTGGFDRLPPPLQNQVFGLLGLMFPVAYETTMTFGDPVPPFSRLGRVQAGGERSRPFVGPVLRSVPASGTTLFGHFLIPPSVITSAAFGGLFVRPYGEGFGVFSTGHQWSRWNQEDRAFELFHADLWSRRAVVALDSPRPLVSEPLALVERENGVCLINAAADELPARLWLMPEGEGAYGVGAELERSRDGTLTSTISVPADSVLWAPRLPVLLHPDSRGRALLKTYSADKVVVAFEPVPPALGGSPMLVVIGEGEYRLAGREHQARWSDGRTELLRASPDGVLLLQTPTAPGEVELSPAED